MADLRDIFAAAHGQSPSAPAPTAQSGGSLRDIFASAHSGTIASDQAVAPMPPTKGALLAGLAADLFDKVTFGGGDELLGAGNAAIDDVLSVFTGGPAGDYSTRKAQAQALREQYQGFDPNMSIALNVAALAAPVPGFLNAAKGAGLGAQTAKAAGAGALYGGLSGTLGTEGDASERATGGAIGATLGGAIGGAAVPVITAGAAGARGVADWLAKYGITPGAFVDDLASALFGSSGSAVRGALGSGGPNASKASPGFTPEELFLAKQLKNTPMSKVAQGADELAATTADDIPLFLPEAVRSPKVERNAKFIANYEPSMEFAQDAIRARTAGAEGRASELFDSVSGVRDTFAGARQLSSGADDIIQSAVKQREAAAAPWYLRAYSENPTIESTELTKLLEKDEILSSAVRSLKKTANNADLPDNATELLVKARKRLWEKASDLEAKGFASEASDIKETYVRLNEIMKRESPALAQADAAFAAGSEQIAALEDTFLSNLAKITPEKADSIGQVFNLPASRIQDLRGTFEKAGKLDQWNAGIRSYLQRSAEASREGQNYTLKIAGSTLQKDKLRAALGDSADDVLKGLDYENRFFEGKNKYFMGSPTEPAQQEKEAFRAASSLFGNITDPTKWAQALQGLFGGTMDEELAQNMARIYFDPKRGADALSKVMPLLERYAANRAATDAAARGGRYVASRAPVAFNDLDLLMQGSQGAALPRSQPQQSSSQRSGSPEQSAQPPKTSASGTKDPQDFEPVAYTPNDNLFADLFTTADLRGGNVDAQTLEAFQSKVVDIADELGADPRDLMAVMRFETGGTLNPAEKNRAGSGATGLIQFMPSTAKELTGAESKEAAIKLMESMSPVEQLDYVQKYLAPFKGRLNSLEDVYMAVLWPKAVGKDPDYALFERGTKAYWQNRGLDLNKDGVITKAEATSKVRRFNDRKGTVEA